MKFFKKEIFLNKIFEILMIFWTLFIFCKWFLWNDKISPLLFSDKWIITLYVLYNNIFPFFIGLFVSLILFFYIKRRSNTNIASIKISPIVFIFLFLLFTTVLYFLSAHIRILFPNAEAAITTGIELLHIKNLLLLLLSQTLWIIAFTLSIFLLGNILYKFFFKKYIEDEKDKLTLFLIKSSVGIIFWSLIVFFLAAFSIFYKSAVLTIFFIILLFERRTILQILKLFIKKIEFKILLNSYFYWLVMLFLFFISMLLIDSLQLFSRGFDNLMVYLNISNIISETHSLISGYYPYPYSLLASIGYLFAKNNAIFALGNQLIYGILGMLALFKSFSLFIKNEKIAFLFSFLWFTLPLTTYYFNEDAKVELLLFYTCTVSVILFLKWINTKKNIYLYLAALTLSFSFSVKILTIFLIISLIPIILYNIKKNNFINKLKTILIFIGIGVLTSSPWIVYNLSTHKNDSKFSIQSILVSKNQFDAGYLNQNNLANEVNISICEDTTSKEDISRFQSKSNAFLKPLVIPWELLKNKHENVNKSIVNIGFILIVFYGLLYFFCIQFIFKREKIKTEVVMLILVNIIYWLLWGIFAKEIIWYGYSGFPIYFLLIFVLFISISKKYKFLYILLTFLIIFNILINILSFDKTFARASTINYISERKINLSYQKILDILNKEENENKRIYSTAERAIYHIKHNNKRVLIDGSLGYFSCLAKNYNDDEIKAHFENSLKIDYIIYSLGKPTVRESNNTLVKKAIVFYQFAENNLELISETNNIKLFKIKKDI